MSANSPDTFPSATAGSPGSDVGDDNLKHILESLSDESWDFRTVDGICKSTGLDRDLVVQILEGHPELIRKSAVPDRKGRMLYTLRSRSHSFTELVASLRAFVSKST